MAGDVLAQIAGTGHLLARGFFEAADAESCFGSTRVQISVTGLSDRGSLGRSDSAVRPRPAPGDRD